MLHKIKDKNLHTWMGGWARHLARQALAPRVEGPRHLLFAVCDHYEPLWGKPDPDRGAARVQAWHQRYPRLADRFRDADGHPPRHSFFFPGEEYAPEYLDPLADLARRGYGEVELHLHHDDDTAEDMRADIERYLDIFAEHGHLSRDPDGRLRYAFIHGNWCLANARRDGRWCGVDEELPLLWETGCYADFTFPSAPDECQPNIVNEIYWPTGELGARRAYERGARARVGERRRDRLLMVQGPLALARRPGSFSVRIESAALDASDPPSAARLRTWAAQNIHVEGRPEWVFVKLHTHGAPEDNAEILLGEPMQALHRELTTRYDDGRSWILHYVTAREMFNIAAAAMDGKDGDPNDFRDHEIPPPPVAT
jgi:hypothetical protein